MSEILRVLNKKTVIELNSVSDISKGNKDIYSTIAKLEAEKDMNNKNKERVREDLKELDSLVSTQKKELDNLAKAVKLLGVEVPELSKWQNNMSEIISKTQTVRRLSK